MIKTLIKQGINKGIDDTGKLRRAVYKWLGREDTGQRVQSFVPFGTFGCPPSGTLGLLLAIRGDESNVIALDGDAENRIKKNCKSGEYGIGNPTTKANIYFKENGDVHIEIPKGKFVIESSNGDIDINTASGIISISGDEINLNNGSKGVARLDDTVSTTLNAVDLAAIAAQIGGLFIPNPAPVPPTGQVIITGNNVISSASATVKAGN